MNLSDIFLVLQWYVYIFLIGIIFLPISQRIFARFIDKGYIFSKTLGIIILSYSVYILGIAHIAPFARVTLFGVLIIFALLQLFRFRISFIDIFINSKKYFLIEELFFLAGLFLWAYVRGFAPEIHGLEKYMDYGFINSILRSEYFPPKDMWLAPEYINYYYFGHLATAVLTKLADIPSRETYNLMLGTLVGLTFASSFSIAINLFARIEKGVKKHFLKIVVAGILTACLVTFSGNLHTLYTFFKPYGNEKPVPFFSLLKTECIQSRGRGPDYLCVKETTQLKPKMNLELSPLTFPNSYWYPNATRFIHNTIHEFPLYSWVVADLHGHVTDIPLVLLTIAYAFSLYIKPQPQKASSKSISKIKKVPIGKITDRIGRWGIELRGLSFAGFLLAVMYMTNAWDGIIYLLLFVFVIFAVTWGKTSDRSFSSRIQRAFPVFFFSSCIVFLSFILFSLPFSIFFKPFASGIGIICGSEFLGPFIGNESVTRSGVQVKDFVGNIGPILFESNHCARSPWWQLFTLYGFFYFFVISFVIFLVKVKKILSSDIYVILLIILGSLLIIIPEFIYLKDIYPDHYRANTMFKLVFQAFILLSISTGYIIVRILPSIQGRAMSMISIVSWFGFVVVTIFLLCIVFIYPFQATNSYYGNLVNYKGLDGLKYLQESYPDDYLAVEFINRTISGQPVILEAQGDSYTDYARVSSNTGLPTVLGWTVHEWLWRGSYDVPAPRVAEIQTMYETEDIEKTLKLLSKYNVEYVFVGDLEREKYTSLNIDKFGKLGKVVFQKGDTKIYKLDK